MDLFDVYPLMDIEPVKGEGAYIYDRKGAKYLDFYGGHAVISIGHCHPYYTEKLQSQLNKLVFYSNSVQNPLQKELAAKLGELSGYQDYKLFLCNSGAEANENALKLASFYNGRKKFLVLNNAFHGRTGGVVNFTKNPKIISPANEQANFVSVDLNDIEQLEKNFDDEICAVFVEGIQGIAGIYECSDEFLQKLSSLCRQHNAVLILDEIQSGYGRSGKFFAHQYYKIEADLITTAKGMGNGFPIGGVLIHPKFQAEHGLLGTTFGGNHLACTAGIAVLDALKDEGLPANAEKMGELLMKALREFKEVRSVRGKGLMIGLEFDFPVANLRKELVATHQIITGSAANKNTIRLLPPLTIGESEVDLFLQKFQKALANPDHYEKLHLHS